MLPPFYLSLQHTEAEEVLGMVLPADEDATLPLDPAEEALNEPAPHLAA